MVTFKKEEPAYGYLQEEPASRGYLKRNLPPVVIFLIIQEEPSSCGYLQEEPASCGYLQRGTCLLWSPVVIIS